jgi:TonB family protein
MGVKPITAYLIEQSPEMDAVPLPEVKLERPKYRAKDLTEIRFEDTDQGDVGSVVATASAPRLTESCARACDPSRFAESAGLSAGQSVTVVLVVQVQQDGSTGTTEVIRSSGNAAIDAAAVQYALTLRWVPGTRNRQATSIRIRLPITLSYQRRTDMGE